MGVLEKAYGVLGSLVIDASVVHICESAEIGKETLQFSRSGYNGHIHAKCSTDKCVAWME